MIELKGTEHAYLRGHMNRNRGLALLFAFASLLPLAFPFDQPLPLLGSIVLWFLAFQYLRRSRSYRVGILGERFVAEALRGLDDSYRVLHDVLIEPGRGNIDHVVVGPTGVFCLETKNFSREVGCNGDEWYIVAKFLGLIRMERPLRSVSLQTRRNAEALEGLLRREQIRVAVEPLAVFPNPRARLRLENPTLKVVGLPGLLPALRDKPSALEGEEVERIGRVLLAKVLG